MNWWIVQNVWFMYTISCQTSMGKLNDQTVGMAKYGSNKKLLSGLIFTKYYYQMQLDPNPEKVSCSS